MTIDAIGSVVAGIPGQVQPRRVYPVGYTSRLAYVDFEHPHRVVEYRCTVGVRGEPADTSGGGGGGGGGAVGGDHGTRQKLCFKVERLLPTSSSATVDHMMTPTPSNGAATSLGGSDGSGSGSSALVGSASSGVFEGDSAMAVWGKIHAMVRSKLWVSKHFRFPPGDWLFGLIDVHVLHFLEGLPELAARTSFYQYMLKMDGEPASILHRLSRVSLRAYKQVMALSRRLLRMQHPMAAVPSTTVASSATPSADDAGATPAATAAGGNGDGGDGVAGGDGGGGSGGVNGGGRGPQLLMRNAVIRKVSRRAQRGNPGYYPGLENVPDGPGPKGQGRRSSLKNRNKEVGPDGLTRRERRMKNAKERREKKERQRVLAKENKKRREEEKRAALKAKKEQRLRDKAERAAKAQARAEARAVERRNARKEKAEAKEREKRQRAEQSRLHDAVLASGRSATVEAVRDSLQRIGRDFLHSHRGIKMPKKSEDDGRLRDSLEALADAGAPTLVVAGADTGAGAGLTTPRARTPVSSSSSSSSSGRSSNAGPARLLTATGLRTADELDEAMGVFDFLGTFVDVLGLGDTAVSFDEFAALLRVGAAPGDPHLMDRVIGALLDMVLGKVYGKLHTAGNEATKRMFGEHPLTPRRGNVHEIPHASLRGLVNGLTWRALAPQVLGGVLQLNVLGSVAPINARAAEADILEAVFANFPGVAMERPPVVKIPTGVLRTRDREPSRAFQAAASHGVFYARCEVCMCVCESVCARLVMRVRAVAVRLASRRAIHGLACVPTHAFAA